MHSNSKLLFKKYGVFFIRENQSILEIGPDAIPSSYRECVSAEGLRWETLEIQRDDKPAPAPGPRCHKRVLVPIARRGF